MIVFVLILACAPKEKDTGRDVFAGAEGDADTDTDTDTDADSDSDSDSDTDTTPKGFDCKSDLPTSLPLDGREIEGSVTSEDLAIDNEGYIVGSDRLNLYRSNIKGDVEMIVPNVGNVQAIVVLPNDDTLLFQEGSNELELYDPEGNRTVLSTSYYIPFADVNAEGIVYASTMPDTVKGGAIVRIDPVAETIDEIYQWTDIHPWGITFDEKYDALYVSMVRYPGFNGDDPARVVKLQLDVAGEVVGDPEVFVEFENATGYAEGLTVDACGNVYFSLATGVVRVSKDAKKIETIWVGTVTNRSISGLSFGRGGPGGSEPMKLYASNPYEKFAVEIDAGVPGTAAW